MYHRFNGASTHIILLSTSVMEVCGQIHPSPKYYDHKPVLTKVLGSIIYGEYYGIYMLQTLSCLAWVNQRHRTYFISGVRTAFQYGQYCPGNIGMLVCVIYKVLKSMLKQV